MGERRLASRSIDRWPWFKVRRGHTQGHDLDPKFDVDRNPPWLFRFDVLDAALIVSCHG